jgi:WD40 repeat protein
MSERQNPYVGPRAFRTGEKLFGRRRETAELVDLLIAERIVLMSSPSGAGKSSLINAGLIPAMCESGFTVFPPIRVGQSLPKQIMLPANANRFLFSVMLSLDESRPVQSRLPLDRLLGMSLEEYLTHLDLTADSFLFVLDQFEEMLTIDPNQRAPKQEFFDRVGRALHDRKRWALFAMREEYVAGVLPYARSIPTRFTTTFHLDLLSRQASIEAIREPARQMGVEFEPAAAEELQRFLSLVRVQQLDGTTIEEVGEFAEPVQLQVVCHRLWDMLSPTAKEISVDHVRNLGEVERALTEYYEAVVATASRLSGRAERTIRDWIERALITPTGIRGEVMQMPNTSGSLDNRAIASLVDGYLVREEKRRGNSWYELAHDRLIQVVKSSNSIWFEKNLHPMQRQVELWEQEGRPDRLLLGGRDLKVAERWAAANDPLIMQRERDFLDRSVSKGTSDLVRRVTLGFGFIALTVALGFSLLEWRMSVEQRSQALLNQSWRLSELASREAEAGDPVTAELLALSGLPDYEPSLRLSGGLVSLERPVQFFLSRLFNWLHPDRPYLPELEGRVYASYLGYRERAVFDPRNREVLSVAFSPAGSLIAVGSSGPKGDLAQVWDVASGRLLRELAGHGGPVRTIAFTADGLRVVTGSDDHIVRVFDAQSGRLISQFDQGGGILCVAVSAHGNRIVVGSDDHFARVWDWITESQVLEISQRKHSGPVSSVAISADGSVVVSGSTDATALVWDVSNRTLDHTVRNGLSISGVALSVDMEYIVTASPDGSVRVWQWKVSTEQPIKSWMGTDEITSVVFDPTGTRIILASRDKVIRLWDWSTNEKPYRLVGHAERITSVGISADGNSLVSGSDDGTARVWSVRPVMDPIVLTHDELVRAVGASENGARIVTGSSSKTAAATLWDGNSGKKLAILDTHGSEVWGVAISRDGSRIVTGSNDGIVRVWGADLAKAPLELTGPPNTPVSCVALSADARKVAAGFDGEARVWDAETGTVLRLLTDKKFQGRVASIAFSRGGDLLATASRTSVRLWDLTIEHPAPWMDRHPGYVLAVAISHNGRLIASGGRENGVRVLDRPEFRAQVGDDPAQLLSRGGEQIGSQGETSVLNGPEDPTEDITSLAFTEDDARIIAGAADGKLRMWDLKRSKLIGAIRVYSKGITGVAMAAQDTLVVTSSEYTAHVSKYFGSTPMLVDAAERKLPRCLTQKQMQKFYNSSIPPRWCITGRGFEHEPDSSQWQPRWPYNTEEWRQWLVASDRGERVKTPESE